MAITVTSRRLSITGRVFVAGTDTDVGKTHVTATWASRWRHAGRDVGVYKPVASGGVPNPDAARLAAAAGMPDRIDDVCPLQFREPLSPPAAARREGRRYTLKTLVDHFAIWRTHDGVLIEGAGGLFSPITDDDLNIDLAAALDVDELILVAADRLGVQHQVLACLHAAAARGRPVTGIVLNRTDDGEDRSVETNRYWIERFTDVPIVETFGFLHPGGPVGDAETASD